MILFLALSAGAAPPSQGFQERLSGVYEVSIDPAQVKAITEAAIDKAVNSLNWTFRPFARPALRRSTGLCQRTRLELSATHFSGACVSRREQGFSYPVSGLIPTYVDEGEEYQVTFTLRDGEWVALRHEGPRGGMVARWSVSDGGGLEVEKRVFSSRLPEDMAWTVPYGPVR